MQTDTLRIIIPIATFILGGALTLLVKVFEQRRDTKRRSVSSIQQLTNEWYNQLHEILIHKEEGQDPEFINAYTKYLSNRIILPKLLTHLEILKGFNDTHPYIIEVESFSSMVTNYNNSEPYLFDKVSCLKRLSDDLANDNFLGELDLVIQRIAIQSGVLLR